MTKISREILYWLAIILTHPIGATRGDYLTKPEGMNLGNIKSSLLLFVVFGIVILWDKFTDRKREKFNYEKRINYPVP